MTSVVTRDQIEKHLSDQYAAWASVIYPNGRSNPPASLRFKYDDEGASVYGSDDNEIIIHIPAGNERDFDCRIGKIITKPDKWLLSRIELELLHEMMHELQYKEKPDVSEVGQHFAERFKLLGAGHDAVFFTAIEISAGHLGETPEGLLRMIA